MVGIKSRIHIYRIWGGYTCQFEHVKLYQFFFVGKRTGRHYSCNCGESIPLYRCSVPGSSLRIPLIVLVPPRATIDDLERGRLLGFFPTLLFVGSREIRGKGSLHYMHLYRDKRGVYVPHDSGSDDARSVKTLVDRYRCRRWFMWRSSSITSI